MPSSTEQGAAKPAFSGGDDEHLTGFMGRLRDPAAAARLNGRVLFDSDAPIVAARAPGRLDVMGGIADYSGSHVLEWPIREATLVAVQAASEPGLKLVSLPRESGQELRGLDLDAATTTRLLEADYAEMRRWFASDPAVHWASYVFGAIAVLRAEIGLELGCGLKILADSRVPEGKGVSSSAALEVATLQAVSHLLGSPLSGDKVAALCQKAENFVVGAPCGIMDQMTSALGRSHALLSLRCQPATVLGYVNVPPSIGFWGIDSGIRHAVTGSDYTSVRTGAFMGYRIIAERAGLRAISPSVNDPPVIEDPRWSGYLANLSPLEFEREFAACLPVSLTGADFLARFGGTTDRVTHVDPGRTYAVRQPAAHPIHENARVQRFGQLLAGVLNESTLTEMGKLMYDSHASYSACGLGSDGTDLLVDLVRRSGPASGLYGAKITGGGSGGTVAILGLAAAGPAVAEVARRYRERSGRPTYLFEGSSPGASDFGVRRA